MRRCAIKREFAQHFADDCAEFESVPAKTGADYDILAFRMFVNDEVLVRCPRVKTDAAFAPWGISQCRDMRLHELPYLGHIVLVGRKVDLRRMIEGRPPMEGDLESRTIM